MADPRAGIEALRELGQPTEAGPSRALDLAPPPRRPASEQPQREKPYPSTPEPPSRAARVGERPPRTAERQPRVTASSPPPPVPDRPHSATNPEQRRSVSMTIYLDATARQALQLARDRDSDATVADVMLNAIRATIGELRREHEHEHEAFDPDDPLPPPPRQRRRRHVSDGRPVPVRLSPAERTAVDGLAADLDLSVSALVSVALARSS